MCQDDLKRRCKILWLSLEFLNYEEYVWIIFRIHLNSLNNHYKTMHNKTDLRLFYEMIYSHYYRSNCIPATSLQLWRMGLHNSIDFIYIIHTVLGRKWVSKGLILSPNNIARWYQQKDVGTVGQIASPGAMKYVEKPSTIGDDRYSKYWELLWS